jgi:hypothetical protein
MSRKYWSNFAGTQMKNNHLMTRSLEVCCLLHPTISFFPCWVRTPAALNWRVFSCLVSMPVTANCRIQNSVVFQQKMVEGGGGVGGAFRRLKVSPWGILVIFVPLPLTRALGRAQIAIQIWQARPLLWSRPGARESRRAFLARSREGGLDFDELGWRGGLCSVHSSNPSPSPHSKQARYGLRHC